MLIMWLLLGVIEVIQSAVASVLMASLSIYVMLLIVKPICIFIFIHFLSPFLLLCPFERECCMNSDKDLKKKKSDSFCVHLCVRSRVFACMCVFLYLCACCMSDICISGESARYQHALRPLEGSRQLQDSGCQFR